jgi:hypothetical protein
MDLDNSDDSSVEFVGAQNLPVMDLDDSDDSDDSSVEFVGAQKDVKDVRDCAEGTEGKADTNDGDDEGYNNDNDDDANDAEYKEDDAILDAKADDDHEDAQVLVPEIDDVEHTATMYTVESYGALEGEDIKSHGSRLLPLLSNWKSKEDLKEVISKYGLTCGFKVCCTGWGFTCNKAGTTRDRKNPDLPDDKRRIGKRYLKVGCGMSLRYTFTGRLGNGQRDKSGPVRITFADFTHSGLCVPSANQLLVSRRASGEYSKLSQEMIASILTDRKSTRLNSSH